MLTTNARFIQAIDPNAGVTRACAPTTVTAGAYQTSATIPSVATARTRPANAAANAWFVLGDKAMTPVDFHDRWPLHSTS